MNDQHYNKTWNESKVEIFNLKIQGGGNKNNKILN